MSSWKLVLRQATVKNGEEISEVAIQYGRLGEALIDFLIIGITIFFVIRFIKRLQDKRDNPSDTSVATPKDIQLLNEMKNLLSKQNEILEDKLNRE